MEDNKNESKEDTSGKAALARGKEAIEAQEKIAKQEKGDEKAKEDEKKDAAKWHEEG